VITGARLRPRAGTFAAAVAIACAGACAGETGTIQLELTTAPGSTLLEAVHKLRLTITNPRTVVEAERTEAGFDLVLDVEATGAAGSLIVEGLDASDTLIATGSSPPFPVAAINARIVIYMATPLSIGLAPVGLAGERTGVASATLSYGVVLAGGEDAAGTRTAELAIYNAYDHALSAGLPMPAPRSHVAIGIGSSNAVYLFGGTGPDDQPSGTLWRFDTTVAPAGAYSELPPHPELARSGEIAVPLAAERFVITGAPAADLTFGTMTARGETLASNGAAVAIAGVHHAVFAGDPIVRISGDRLEPVAAAAEVTATAAPTRDGRVVFAGVGTSRDVLAVDAASGAVTAFPDVLSTVRVRPAVAATTRHLIVAGGSDEDGTPIASADILDATSFRLIATLPCLAREGATAHALLNDQIAIVGGAPANAAIELFTPPPPSP
jgi:hypothetical protein